MYGVPDLCCACVYPVFCLAVEESDIKFKCTPNGAFRNFFVAKSTIYYFIFCDMIHDFPSPYYTGKKKKNNVVISEVYPESEYNPSREILDGDGRISMEDLLGPLQDKPGFGKLRKRMDQMKKSEVIEAPLPQAIREKVERGTAYKLSKTDITKWEPIVKKNREAPTIYFDENTDLGFSTVGAIASEFEPRTEFEKQMASLVYDDNVMEAHRKDGSRLLELNKV